LFGINDAKSILKIDKKIINSGSGLRNIKNEAILTMNREPANLNSYKKFYKSAFFPGTK